MKMYCLEHRISQKKERRAWNLWEYCLIVSKERSFPFKGTDLAQEMATAQIEYHYLSKRCFFDTNEVKSALYQLGNLWAELIQGTHDHVCPVSIIDGMKPFWPNLEVTILPQGGHCAFGPTMMEALCAATNRLATRYGY